MFKSFFAGLLIILSVAISSCSAGVSGLQSYVNTSKGYEFLYPNGWIPVTLGASARKSVDVVFRDLVERTENLSVIINEVPDGKTLEDLGTPSEVGYRLLKAINKAPNSDVEAEFLRAESRQGKDKTYYLLEYEENLPDQEERHNIASVSVSRGKIFTFSLSTPERRWDSVKDSFEVAAKSFTVR
ncbi:photosystem II reaction center PsbP family protein [Waterburya agarophytonicola K14]|uniref:Photosystem II reaction center PsbP family protein n=1 Tax=Waterburya agarophytonicola KI4 TaxID=2874699 RepID=A0A964BN78_9CYAN|nr:photosystem II reaction center PsbP [Waterburya agarophytonicola]MCC0176524.1 photosystem II reaction center PsbP family protein [Waterburya agarophytonicola KI4]